MTQLEGAIARFCAEAAEHGIEVSDELREHVRAQLTYAEHTTGRTCLEEWAESIARGCEVER